MLRRKRKSRMQQFADLAVDYLKLKTAGKAAKTAAKGATKPPVLKRIPFVVGAGVAAAVAAKVARGRGGEAQPAS